MSLFIFLVIFQIIVLILVRALLFTPNPTHYNLGEDVHFDKDAAVYRLQQLVMCKTISSYNPDEEDDAEFDKLINLIPVLYPNFSQKCELTRFPDRGLLFKWEGKNHDAPSVMMSHYDVVPVDESGWDKPPFDGIIEDGVLWGRGTLDTKSTLNGALSAAEELISAGFVPENDVYFAFSGVEEINGPGASHIVDYFEENGITLSMVVDEGGAVVENVFPGVSAPCGLIGIAEKGLLDVEYRIFSDGGHASAPAPHTPVGRLSSVCVRIENNPFKYKLSKPVKDLFDTVGRHSTFGYRIIFSNLWLFNGLLDYICKKKGGDLNALVRTTVAFTMMSGSQAPNVIPPFASMVSNLRINPNDSVNGALAYLRSVINDPNVEITHMHSMEPSRVSDTDCPGWRRITNAVAGTWTDCIVSPYLMVQCSDSRYYGRISDKVYRFSAQKMTAEERASIHGNNERIRLESIHQSVEFYIRLLRQC